MSHCWINKYFSCYFLIVIFHPIIFWERKTGLKFKRKLIIEKFRFWKYSVLLYIRHAMCVKNFGIFWRFSGFYQFLCSEWISHQISMRMNQSGQIFRVDGSASGLFSSLRIFDICVTIKNGIPTSPQCNFQAKNCMLKWNVTDTPFSQSNSFKN